MRYCTHHHFAYPYVRSHRNFEFMRRFHWRCRQALDDSPYPEAWSSRLGLPGGSEAYDCGPMGKQMLTASACRFGALRTSAPDDLAALAETNNDISPRRERESELRIFRRTPLRPSCGSPSCPLRVAAGRLAPCPLAHRARLPNPSVRRFFLSPMRLRNLAAS